MRDILIVEDEVYARQSLKKQILKSSFSQKFQVFEAENGKRGLEIFRQEDIGLVFTDIRMPGMDGLELLGKIKALRPDARVIMISAYADFEYAKTAMKLGAEEYLLKPVSEMELRQCLSLKSYEQHRETDTGEDMVSRFIRTHLLSRADSRQDLLAAKMFQKIFGQYQILILYFPEGETPGRDNMIRLTESCGREEVFTGFRLLNISESRYVLVLYSDGETTFFAKRLLGRLRDVGCLVYGGLSAEKADAKELTAAYQQAVTALESKIFTGEQLVIFQDVCRTRNERFFMNDLQKDQLILALRKGDRKAAGEVLWEVFSLIRKNDAVSSWSLEFFLTQITLIYQQSLENKSITDAFRRTMFRYELVEFSSLDEAEEKLTGDAEKICSLPAKTKGQKPTDVVEQMKAYARENYAGDFTVKRLAEEVFYMNPAYLSHLFAEKTGESWSSYVKKIRMEKAAELMEEKDFSITEIASMTGYNDVSLFIRNFKQATGMTPKRYRDELRRKKEM